MTQPLPDILLWAFKGQKKQKEQYAFTSNHSFNVSLTVRRPQMSPATKLWNASLIATQNGYRKSSATLSPAPPGSPPSWFWRFRLSELVFGVCHRWIPGQELQSSTMTAHVRHYQPLVSLRSPPFCWKTTSTWPRPHRRDWADKLVHRYYFYQLIGA